MEIVSKMSLLDISFVKEKKFTHKLYSVSRRCDDVPAALLPLWIVVGEVWTRYHSWDISNFFLAFGWNGGALKYGPSHYYKQLESSMSWCNENILRTLKYSTKTHDLGKQKKEQNTTFLSRNKKKNILCCFYMLSTYNMVQNHTVIKATNHHSNQSQWECWHLWIFMMTQFDLKMVAIWLAGSLGIFCNEPGYTCKLFSWGPAAKGEQMIFCFLTLFVNVNK